MRPPLGTSGRAGAALLLAAIAGFVDAAGYVLLEQVYTSHMTGNTSGLGIGVAGEQWNYALRHAWPIAAFVLGLITGATLTEYARRRRIHSRLAMILGAEMTLLAAVIALRPHWAPAPTLWVGVLAFAMGMQTVTVTRVADQRVYTTYLTGTLAKFAEAITAYGFWLADQWRWQRSNSRRELWLREAVRHRLLQHALLTAGLWTAFVAGGLSGATLALRRGAGALLLPIGALGLLLALDIVHPVAPVAESEPIGFEV
ncbi:MAG TPA: YoaK family protein [Terriglobales bacterium]|nr:YoaK family protein [Terriglobales bacterium]